jgi:hypothetical protein
MRGFCWEGGPRVDAAAVAPLAAAGADWISQTPFGFSPALEAPEVILASGHRAFWGESDEGLAETARLARERGIKTLLKPHLWVRGGAWVGGLEMKSEDDWRRWFASYESFIVHYATLAEREKMEAFAVGTELPKVSLRAQDWRRVIARVREVYRGPLTYCANWQEADTVAFWDALDFVGVQAYFPLPTRDGAPLAQIRAAWDPIVEKLAALASRTGRPIVFTEVGYKSEAGGLAQPWQWSNRGAVDLALQRDAFQAMFDSVWDKPWFGGTFVWKWHPLLGAPAVPPDRHASDFTPQGKPALEVIRSFYTKRR